MDKTLETVLQISKDIKQEGGDVYFVGGYVRDSLLGKQNKDIDLEIYNISVSNVTDILYRYGKVSQIGASFGILNVSGLDVDFAFPRTEQKTGNKHTDFDVHVDPFMSPKEGAFRRDFTINALMKNVNTGELLDFYGGKQDLKDKIIRYVNKETFVEDNLRTLRACQFASRLGFTVDDNVISLAKTMDYTHLSKERIIIELDKALLSDKPSIALNYLYDSGVLHQLFPELVALKGCEQNKEHHPEGDVWNHTMLVIDEGAKCKHLSKNPKNFMYACLFHDIGKPSTTKLDEKGILRSKYHDTEGADISVQVLSKFTTEKDLLTTVETLTRYHMQAHKLLEIKPSKVRKLMNLVDMNDLLLLNACDVGGRELSEHKLKKEQEIIERRELVESLSMGGFGKVVPFIKGQDLLDMGYVAGKELGKNLKDIYNLQLQGKAREDILDIYKLKLEKVNNPKLGDFDNMLETTYSKFFQNNKLYKEKHTRLLKKYKQLAPIKTSKTPNSNIPYNVFIVIGKTDRYKIICLPDMVIKSDIRNQQVEILFSNYTENSTYRKDYFKQLSKRFNIREEQFQFYLTMYGKLRDNFITYNK